MMYHCRCIADALTGTSCQTRPGGAMSLDDWVISLALMLVVLRQIRGRRLTIGGIVWPVALVGWAAFTYLRTIPDYYSDWLFTIALAVVGLVLGLATGLLTKVYR